ncbi:hypothetical protein Tco_0857772 [Tanacetum coccineum]|uniref:Retrotransposon gag domain-containing protein n=1 Tax=Tanacetum coccineum TaxID=301880 RepID=A0ABQ5B7E9_9ASTR
MEEVVTKNRANYYSWIISITVNGKAAYVLKGRFLDDLWENAFSGTNREDAVKHIEYFIKIVDPIELHNVNHERLGLVVFPISLVGNASKWFEEFKGSITTCVDLTKKNFGNYYPPSHTCNVMGTETKRDPTNTILKEEALKKKAIYEKSWGDATQSVINFYAWFKRSFGNFHELDYELLVKLEECWLKINDHECSPFTNWRDHIRGLYANINTTYDCYLEWRNGRACNDRDIQEMEEQHKEEEYVAVKEYEYDGLTRTNEDACHAYQEIFCNMDEGWLVRRAE